MPPGCEDFPRLEHLRRERYLAWGVSTSRAAPHEMKAGCCRRMPELGVVPTG
jgi:hypothetical protein